MEAKSCTSEYIGDTFDEQFSLCAQGEHSATCEVRLLFNFGKFGSILPQFSGGNNNYLDRATVEDHWQLWILRKDTLWSALSVGSSLKVIATRWEEGLQASVVDIFFLSVLTGHLHQRGRAHRLDRERGESQGRNGNLLWSSEFAAHAW